MRLIDADALIERIKYTSYAHEYVRTDHITETLLSELCSPTVDVEIVKHGYWIKEPYEPYYCSNCVQPAASAENYCSQCGTKMDRVKRRGYK